MIYKNGHLHSIYLWQTEVISQVITLIKLITVINCSGPEAVRRVPEERVQRRKYPVLAGVRRAEEGEE